MRAALKLSFLLIPSPSRYGHVTLKTGILKTLWSRYAFWKANFGTYLRDSGTPKGVPHKQNLLKHRSTPLEPILVMGASGELVVRECDPCTQLTILG